MDRRKPSEKAVWPYAFRPVHTLRDSEPFGSESLFTAVFDPQSESVS